MSLPEHQNGKKLPQYAAALSVCLGSLAAGAVSGWTGNVAEDMKANSYKGLPIDDHSLSLIGSSATLGAALGCIPIGKLCDLFGRKKAMLLLTIPFVIGWLLILFPRSLLMIYTGRFLTGMAGGAFCVSAPIYISEIAEKQIRGALGECKMSLPEHQNGKKLPQYAAALSVCLGSLAAGAVSGWTGNVAEDMKANSYKGLPIDDHSLSLIGSSATLGAALGCIPIGKLCDLFGRKKAMLLLTIPFVIGWLLILFPRSLLMIYTGRFLTGMAGGAFCVSAPIYISEIAEKQIRGALGGYFDLLLCTGIFLAYVIAVVVNIEIYTLCMASFPILFGIVFFFQPESPMHIVKKNKEDKAERVLLRLRGSKYDLKSEIQDMKKNLFDESDQEPIFMESIMKTASKRAFFIVFTLMYFRQMGGIQAVIFYTGTIFQTAGSTLDSTIGTIIIGGLQILASLISSFIVDRLGRRVLLLISISVSTVSVLALAVFLSLKERNLVDEITLTSLGLIPLISLSVFVSFFSLGLGPISWILSAELFPPEVKSLGTGLSASFNWVMSFFVTITFFYFQDMFGKDITFYLFASQSLLGTLFIYFHVPETKGKSLAEIQRELNR
ncbi:hypothetical protein FQA39_LY05454 [Lamprigera yunnana]|nr:hypothetical protein FQA39_LY05454 [Lamprigera yunnana]